jgi:D-glycero-alpha-D-manno-heptose-7-phosphate kinase
MKEHPAKRRMIMSKTPLRITFVGGGTDLSQYYSSYGTGCVISAAINKYIYVLVHKAFDNKTRVRYSKTEIVDNIEDIEHPTVREALKLLEITDGIDINVVADITDGGTGLGSSSAFLVGLLNALHAWKGEYIGATRLAEEAVLIERGILKEPGGKQDQYIAALGGIQFLEFNKDETVVNTPIIMYEESRRRLEESLLFMYTGKQRKSTEILKKQSADISAHIASYNKMASLASEMFTSLIDNRWIDTGKYLHENWLLKRTLSEGISNEWIDSIYDRAMDSGALGGKLIGAGAGGFMLFFAPSDKHEEIIRALPELKQEPFEFEALGSRIIYIGD